MGLFGFNKKQESTSPVAASPQAAPAPQVVSAPAGKLDLAKRAPALVDLNKKATLSLQKNNLVGVKAAVYLVLDHSGSMRTFYNNGSVQRFTERVLAAAVNFDDDGSVPTMLFDSKAHKIHDISVDDYQGAVDRLRKEAGRMGTTDYAGAMREIVRHYKKSGATEPALVIFETDGSPDSKAAAERVLCESSNLPIFWQFVGFGRDSFEFLRKLDELAVPKKRVVDNAGFFAATDPDAMTPEALYDSLMGEFPEWLKAARAKGIVS